MSETLFEEKFPIFTFQWSNQVFNPFQIKQTSLNIDRWKDNFSRLMVSQFSGFWICKSLDLIKFSTLVTKIVKTKLEKKKTRSLVSNKMVTFSKVRCRAHRSVPSSWEPSRPPAIWLSPSIEYPSPTKSLVKNDSKQSHCHWHYSPKLPSSHCWYCRVPLRCGPVVLGKERTLR